MFENEDNRIEDVASLRNRLRWTELSIHSVGEQLSQSGGHDDSDHSVHHSPPIVQADRLTIEDLQRPDVPLSQSHCSSQDRPHSGTAERRTAASSLSPASSRSRSVSRTARLIEMESAPVRKMGYLRQENACLTMQNKQLVRDLESMQYEMATSKTQMHLLGSKFGIESSNVVVMSEQILSLEAELEAQAKELRAAELRAERGQEAAAQSDSLVASLTEELSALRAELDTKTAVGRRAEQQRNQALHNAEQLKDAFKDYKATISIKLKKVMENESKLKESLIECDREKEEFEMKCTALESEKAEQSQTISQLKEEVRQAKSLTADRSDLQARLEEAGRRALQMERELGERTAACRELASLRNNLVDLRALTQGQEQRVAQSHREAQQSQAELAGLEAILALLHLREGPEGPLCVRPCLMPPVDYSGTTHLLKPKPGECYQQLLPVLQSIEADRAKQSSLAERLQDRLSRAQEEISSLQSSMAQRASHYQSLHTELLEKVSQATNTEKELKRKSARVAALEKQLQEKTSAYSQAALKNTELEQQLLEKTSTLQHYQSLMTKKQREYQQSMDKCKKSQTQQCMELQHRTEVLQLSVNELQSQVLELGQELSSAWREREEVQKGALLLQTSLDQLTQERETEVRQQEDMLHSFKEQAAKSATKVCELQSSLTACQEELSSYLQQTEEVKENYKTELQEKSNKISSLQEKLHSARLVCQSSSEQNLQLQVSLQQQQTMLTESTARIAELEESQSLLQRQVSGLEQQLERARASLEEKLSQQEMEAQEKDRDLQEMNQQSAQLTSEMTKCRGQLLSMESELQCLRKETGIKASQISLMNESLQHTQSQLDKMSDMAVDLEEKLHRSEADRRNSVQRVQILEGQLQGVRRELTDTLKQLQELRDVLQRTQVIADDRKASLEKLTVELRESKRELEERAHELLDMDNAMKERQGELQQRTKLLSQLDVAIRDHKQEMEMKVESLQQSLDARERELRDTQRELKDTQRELKDGDMKDSQELGVCQEKLQRLVQELQETHCRCEAQARELDATKQQSKEKEARLSHVQEEFAIQEARWLQSEARLQNEVTSLQQELELEREQHSTELTSLQQTRGQLLKVSEQISSTMRSSQEQLTTKLQQTQSQLDHAKAQCDQTKAQVSQLQSQLDQTMAHLDQTRAELDHTRTRASHLQTRVDQSQAQLLQLEQTRTLYDQARAQNSHLQAQLEQLRAHLNQARAQVAQLQTQLHVSEKTMETSNETLLIKESEVTRLQAKISSLERASDRHLSATPTSHLPPYTHKLSLPATHTRSCSSPCSPPASPTPKHPQTTIHSPTHTHTTGLHSPTHTLTGSLPTAHTHLLSVSHLSNQTDHHQTSNWLQTSSSDSSLDLPPSLKATLREALKPQPWESSSSSFSTPPFPDTVDHSWQGLSAMEATTATDVSFNPLTYMVDKLDGQEGEEDEGTNSDMEAAPRQEGCEEETRRESVDRQVGQKEEEDLRSLTGMLRFVNQTLAKQEDTSLWSSTGISQTGHNLTLQRDIKETGNCGAKDP